MMNLNRNVQQQNVKKKRGKKLNRGWIEAKLQPSNRWRLDEVKKEAVGELDVFLGEKSCVNARKHFKVGR